MTKQFLVGLIAAVLLLVHQGRAQSSAADLLQRGIFTQETTGDIDGAIKIYRQVIDSASGSRSNALYAAQAQYRLVVCMLLKADPASASREFQLLEKNFPSQQDLIALARTMMPGSGAVLPVPWPETEQSQLNVKRDGMATGETLYYSVDPAQPASQSILRSELRTKTTTRAVRLLVDRETLRPIENRSVVLTSNDDSGDPAADAFGGPAIDLEESVFVMRRLPLAVGYRTTMPVTSFTLGQKVPKQVEVTVTGIEAVQVTAGKYNCYKVFVSPLAQTFWIGIDGARPLVKFQSGKVEADLVKMWGPGGDIHAVMGFLPASAWQSDGFGGGNNYGGETVGATAALSASLRQIDSNSNGSIRVQVTLTRIYTPTAEIADELRRASSNELSSWHDLNPKIRQDSIRKDPINGQQTLIYIADNTQGVDYEIWIGTENSVFHLSSTVSRSNFPILRFFLDPLLATIKVP